MINWKNVQFVSCRVCDGELQSYRTTKQCGDKLYEREHDICGICLWRFEVARLAAWRKNYHAQLLVKADEWNGHRIKTKVVTRCSDRRRCALAWSDLMLELRSKWLMSLAPDPVPKDVRFVEWIAEETKKIARGRKITYRRPRQLEASI